MKKGTIVLTNLPFIVVDIFTVKRQHNSYSVFSTALTQPDGIEFIQSNLPNEITTEGMQRIASNQLAVFHLN